MLGQGIEPPSWRAAARRCPICFPACEVVAVADRVGSRVAAAGRVYFAIDARLHLGRLRDRLEQTTPRSHWERSALAGLHDDLVAQHRRLTIEAFGSGRCGRNSPRAARASRIRSPPGSTPRSPGFAALAASLGRAGAPAERRSRDALGRGALLGDLATARPCAHE